MRKVAEILLKNRWTVLFLILLVSLFFLLGFRKLRVESDVVKWLKQDTPEVELFKYIGENYGGNEIALVALEMEDVFTYKGLKLVRDLDEAFSNLEGVSFVTSLVSILDIKKTEEGIEVKKLVDKNNLPSGPEELKRLREYTLSKDLYRGKIVSSDGRITLVLVRLREDADKPSLAKKIRKITEEKLKEYRGDVRAYYGGMPLQMEEINSIVLKDIVRLIPIVVLVVILVLFTGFRNLRGVVLPLTVVLLATLWSIGLMGWLKVPLSVISNIMPVLLIAIGTAYSIHFLSRFREELRKGNDKKEALVETMRETGPPILLAALTTLAGFLSFTGSYLVPITHFGIFTALGVFFAMVLTLSLVPVILFILPPPKDRGLRIDRKIKVFDKFALKLERLIIGNARLIVAFSFLVVAFAIYGLSRVTTSVNLMEYFPKNSDIRKSSEILREHFGGDLPVELLVRGDLKDPYVLKEFLRVEKFLRNVRGIHNPQSLADLLTEMNYKMNGRRTIPKTREGVANLLFMLEGEGILSRLVGKDYREGLIEARFSEVETGAIIGAWKKVSNFLENEQLKEFVVVDLDSVEDSRRLLEFKESRTAEEILWDARYRLHDTTFFLTGLIEVLDSLWDTPIEVGQAEKRELRGSLLEFLFDESEDIRGDIGSLAESIVNLWVSGRGREDILKLLKSRISEEVLEEDPEYLDYLMSNISSILEEKNEDFKVRQSLEKLLPLFPENLRKDKDFLIDLEADLYRFFEKKTAVPPSLVKSGRVSKIEVLHSGLLPVYTKIHENLWKSQIKSFILAFLIVTLLVAVQLSSPGRGIISTLPILLVVGFNFGLMGVLGIPIDNATMMIASIAIGIGIDYTIHFISRFRFEREESSSDEDALFKTLSTTGRAIVLNALTVGLGFLVLVFATLVPIRRFGWMVALTMGTSALSAITLLPSLILLGSRFFKKEVTR